MGLLILDNSCLVAIQTPEARNRLRKNLRVAGWKMWGTAVNGLEAMKTGHSPTRAQLFETIKWICKDGGMLPWPETLLREAGMAVAEGRPRFFVQWSGLERYLLEDAAGAEEVRKARAFLDQEEEKFQQLFDDRRKPLQEGLKRLGRNPNEVQEREFLDLVWRSRDLTMAYTEGVRDRLEIPKRVSPEDLLKMDVWTLFFDIYGIMAYRRSWAKQTEKRVQRADLLQLVYLGIDARTKRAVATRDNGLEEAGASVLKGRYALAEVAKIDAFLQ